MPNLKKIVKTTQAQYDTLEGGGTVGSHTGLNTNFLYLVEDDNEYVTLGTAQTITGVKTFSNDGIIIGENTNNQIKNVGSMFSFRVRGSTKIGLETNQVNFFQKLVPSSDDSIDVGTNLLKFKDLYLAGKIKDGTNSIAIADIASKTYVDDKLSTVYKSKGSKTVAELNALTVDSSMNGFVYNVTDAGTLSNGSVAVIAGDNVLIVWDEQNSTFTWDKLSGTFTVDLSNYYTKSEVDTALGGKVDKVQGKGLSTNDYDDTEKGNVASNTSARHTHSNKALLDTYTQTEVDIADAVSKKHSHSNKSLLDTYTQTEANLADAVSKKHEHSNKSVLDDITAAYTSEEQTKLSGIATGAQVNVIETIKANGNTITPDANKVVDIPISNPNLIMNPDFRINQRAKSVYTSQSNVGLYTVDRWQFKYGDGTVTPTPDSITGGGITIEATSLGNNAYIRQYVDIHYNALRGQYVTFTVSIDGTKHVCSGIVPLIFDGETLICMLTNTDLIDAIGVWVNADGVIFAQIGVKAGKSCHVDWCKLETGNVSTAFVPPAAAEELLKCQRYYCRIKLYTFARSTTNLEQETVQFPVVMKHNSPTTTFYASWISYISGSGGTIRDLTATSPAHQYVNISGRPLQYLDAVGGVVNSTGIFIADHEYFMIIAADCETY